MDPDVQNIVAKIKANDEEAFRALFELFQEGIFNFLVFKSGDANLAEDILQDTFLKIWRKRSELDETQNIKSYLYTSANNALLNHFRHQKVVYAFEANYGRSDSERSPEEKYAGEEFENMLLSSIENLPEKTRISFMMSRFEDLSYKEIAERTGVSIKTVESHIGKALRIIREKIEEINHGNSG